VTRFESGADARLSTVARYAAAIGVKVEWSVAPVVVPSGTRKARRTSQPHSARTGQCRHQRTALARLLRREGPGGTDLALLRATIAHSRARTRQRGEKSAASQSALMASEPIDAGQ